MVGGKNSQRALTLATLRCFLAVALEGSYTRAAVRLGVSQATVSSGVRAVEQILGAQLVRRSTRRVALTPLGRDFAEATLAAVHTLDVAVEAARCPAGSSGNTGTCRATHK